MAIKLKNFLDNALSDCSQLSINEAKEEIFNTVYIKINALLLSLFRGDKILWLDTLGIAEPSVSQLQHVETLQCHLRHIQNAFENKQDTARELDKLLIKVFRVIACQPALLLH